LSDEKKTNIRYSSSLYAPTTLALSPNKEKKKKKKR
jgi:hypothetical protein